jgi:hypothetical protein
MKQVSTATVLFTKESMSVSGMLFGVPLAESQSTSDVLAVNRLIAIDTKALNQCVLLDSLKFRTRTHTSAAIC